MAAPIILLGTGTSVGKTHVGERLLRAYSQAGHRAYGYKPIESGVVAGIPSDADRLERATSFHVKPSPSRAVFSEPISPHLAARQDGTSLDLRRIRETITALARQVAVLVVELPGGAFSPLSDTTLVAVFARSIPGARILLVAPDRIGVLHDVGATTRAAAGIGLPIAAIVLSAPEVPDASTGLNAAEIPLVTRVPYAATFPREPADAPIGPEHPAYRVARAFNP